MRLNFRRAIFTLTLGLLGFGLLAACAPAPAANTTAADGQQTPVVKVFKPPA